LTIDSNAETLLKCNEQLVADWQEAVEAGERDIDIIVDIFEKMVRPRFLHIF